LAFFRQLRLQAGEVIASRCKARRIAARIENSNHLSPRIIRQRTSCAFVRQFWNPGAFGGPSSRPILVRADIHQPFFSFLVASYRRFDLEAAGSPGTRALLPALAAGRWAGFGRPRLWGRSWGIWRFSGSPLMEGVSVIFLARFLGHTPSFFGRFRQINHWQLRALPLAGGIGSMVLLWRGSLPRSLNQLRPEYWFLKAGNSIDRGLERCPAQRRSVKRGEGLCGISLRSSPARGHCPNYNNNRPRVSNPRADFRSQQLDKRRWYPDQDAAAGHHAPPTVSAGRISIPSTARGFLSSVASIADRGRGSSHWPLRSSFLLVIYSAAGFARCGGDVGAGPITLES